MKTNVLLISANSVGGTRRHVHDIIKHLSHTEFNLFYCYNSLTVDNKFKIDLNDLILNKIPDKLFSVKIKKRPSLSDISNILHIIRYVMKNKITIIHGHGAKGGLYARIVCLLTRKIAIYTPHGGVVHNMFTPIENRVYKTIEQILYPLTDCFIFESNYSAISFEKLINKKVYKKKIVYNGIEIEKKIPAKNSLDEIRISIIGALRKEKGQELIIRNLKQIIAGINRKIVFNLYGDGPLKEFFKSLIEKEDLKDIVIMHGDTADISFVYKNTDIVLIPSLYESFGYVAVEAMQYGIPVIASNVGGLKEIINHLSDGILYDVEDMNSLNNFLKGLIEGEIKLEPCSIMERASNFNIQNMVNNLAHTYSSLLKKIP